MLITKTNGTLLIKRIFYRLRRSDDLIWKCVFSSKLIFFSYLYFWLYIWGFYMKPVAAFNWMFCYIFFHSLGTASPANFVPNPTGYSATLPGRLIPQATNLVASAVSPWVGFSGGQTSPWPRVNVVYWMATDTNWRPGCNFTVQNRFWTRSQTLMKILVILRRRLLANLLSEFKNFNKLLFGGLIFNIVFWFCNFV